MKVHIVHHDDGHIVPRMMQWLADGNGWSIGTDRKKGVDVHYFGPYTAYRGVPTLKAAWFTHFEDYNPGKVQQWHMAARFCDLCCYTSDVEAETLPGDTAMKVTAGIDREHFNVRSVWKGAQQAIGIVGIGQRRKGPELTRQLLKDGYTIQVAGTNWGDLDGGMVDYDHMPDFYNTLSLFVCTSTIEGIPAPPLEALACGVPVVVPSGVGIMDELPAMPGLWHYAAGDYGSLKSAVDGALKDIADGLVDREALRAVTEPYTIEAWCESHRKALEKLAA